LINRLRNSRGLTLIEVVVSAIIIAVSVVALYYMIAQGNILMEDIRLRRTALESIKETLTYVKANNCVIDDLPEEVMLVPPNEDEEYAGIFALLAATVEPEKDEFGNEIGLDKITVSYSWIAQSGRTYILTLADYCGG
jgi:prepilin-type N-terminal cleavage/methylation domain-containing protein